MKWNRSALFAWIVVLFPIIDQRWVSISLAVDTPALIQATNEPARNGDAGKPLTASTSSASTSSETPADRSAPCVLLRNDNVLFGSARQVGEFVIVETSQGGEIRLDRQSVQCWSDSLRNLYRYRVDRRQAGDLSALVQDARWCLRYDLYDLAAQEILAIRGIDPRNHEAKSLEDQLRRQYAAFSATSLRTAPRPAEDAGNSVNPGLTVNSPHDNPSAAPIRIVGYQDPKHDQAMERRTDRGVATANDVSDTAVNVAVDVSQSDDESESVGAVDAPTLRRFASHIQPMLTNRCGRCHDANADPSHGFKISLPPVGTRASSRTTRENLNATLRHVNPDAAEQSVLLIKATTAHGGEPAALDARNAKAIESLRAWLWMVSASMIRSETPSPTTEATDQVQQSSGAATTSEVVPSNAASRPPANIQSGVPQLPSRLPQVDNPFDPDLFNRLTVEANQ